MPKYFISKFVTAILIFLSFGIIAQTRIDSLEFIKPFPKNNLLSSKLDKQLNTYYLNSGINFSNRFSDYSFGIFEDYKSSFIKGIEKTVRDEHHFAINMNYHLSDKIDFGLIGNNTILSDSRTLEINQSSISNVILFSRIKSLKEFSFAPFSGYSNNRQIGENDYGFVYGFEAGGDKINISDFQFETELKFKNEDISPRKNTSRYFNLNMLNYFERNIFNNFNIRYYQSRKDFYINADSVTSQQFSIKNNIQNRIESGYLLQNRFFFDEFLDILTLDATGKVSFRNIERGLKYKSIEVQSSSVFDSQIDELKLELDAQLGYRSRIFSSSIRFTMNEKDEKHKAIRFQGINEAFFNQREESEQQKNNNSTYATLSFDGDFNLTEKDKITLNVYQSKLKYDTPSLLNDDDRDEILSIARLGFYRQLNPFFTAFINAEGSYAHTVYIFASRSSNNNINRTIRLKTGGEYIGSNFSSFNSFDVSANYTVYDFEDLTSPLKSFSFRQFTAIDSTTIQLTSKTSLFIFGYIKISEQGILNWNSFSEKPTRALKEIYFEPRLILYRYSSMFSFGIRYFSLSTFNYKGKDLDLDSEYRSIGPTTIIQSRLFKKLLISLTGFYEFISLTNSESRQQANLNFGISWNF
ncbi:Hypothetical protein IALB_2125 [Ignavibacterium album JCM 16511]|uniref:Uncharacterized protein n=1 Tax=Ignavibacterium album (strain DSM 19864 / JCM 16511 / NBRC 101810 / Mat9-16) TaxID=945713 RepID=I0ALH3_IGNAJ|nr:hypothetical protein [Ignavibacterium album]AFH49830.1 Hypothetical protein IALB_2125 [Ignavibacterium album JCM 16511]